MTREQHDAASNGDSCGGRTSLSTPLPLRPSGQDARREQDALLQSAGLLVPSLVHELSNPLCGVRSVLERMSRKPALEDAERHLLRLAIHQCDQMRLLLRELQQFVIPASADPATFALDQTLKSVLLLVRKHLLSCGYGVEFTQPTQPLPLHGEEGRIRLLLVHLLLRCCNVPAGEGCRLQIQAGIEGCKTQLLLRWHVAPGREDSLQRALSSGEDVPWFDTILHQHDGEVQLHQQSDGLALSIQFPLAP